MGGSGDIVMNRLVLLPLVLPFACLALLSFVAFVGVGAIAGALHVIRLVMAALGISRRRDEDPWHGAVGDAHPLEYIEARD
jgi:hypothetical protein